MAWIQKAEQVMEKMGDNGQPEYRTESEQAEYEDLTQIVINLTEPTALLDPTDKDIGTIIKRFQHLRWKSDKRG